MTGGTLGVLFLCLVMMGNDRSSLDEIKKKDTTDSISKTKEETE
jgi:hypothetical protein